jgi:hypothetical protein
LTLGDGKKPQYAALLLFFVGLVAGAFALYAALNRGHYVAPLAAFLLLTGASSFLVAASRNEDA